jgi:hypothetical protein
LPPSRRSEFAAAIREAFAAGLNDLLYLTAGLALAGAICALLLIRRKDFVARGEHVAPAASAQAPVAHGAEQAG